jgi:hypothetical protein
MENKKKFSGDAIYTTGAYIFPKLIDGVWRFVVSDFEDDTYQGGEIIDLNTAADEKEGLINDVGEEDDDEEHVGYVWK